MNLEENFIKYKDITLVIIQKVEAEEYERLIENFQQRQSILDDINKINYTREEINKFYIEYEIQNIEKKLTFEMNIRKVNLLKKMKENEKKQLGMAGYNNISAKAVFLSKEI